MTGQVVGDQPVFGLFFGLLLAKSFFNGDLFPL